MTTPVAQDTNPRSVFHLGYQRRDFDVVDYHEYQFEDSWFRGPDPGPASPDQLTFLGAAQTLGCFTDDPFPTLVGRTLGRPVRNLGHPGAGPRFFLERPALVAEVNRGAAAVVQVMSARSEDNAEFRSGGLEHLTRRRDGVQLGAAAAYRSMVEGTDRTSGHLPARVERLVRSRMNRRRLPALVRETRRNWIESYRALLDCIEVPVVLLWFSTRAPDYVTRYDRVSGLLGAFPQLVDEATLGAVVPCADHFVEVTSTTGLPQPLFSRFDRRPTTVDPADDRPDLGGKPWTHNTYYPSPAMHAEAADALSAPLEALLR